MSYILAVTFYGQKLRDTDIAINRFDTREEAVDALHADFKDDMREAAESGVIVDVDTEEDLLYHLKWQHDVIAAIQEVQ